MSIPIQSIDGNDGLRAAGDVRRIDPADRNERVRDTENRSSGTARESLVNLDEKIEFEGRTAKFSYDPDLDRIIVKIYSSDSQPKEIVRQFPPEQYQAFASRFREMIGVIFDEQV